MKSACCQHEIEIHTDPKNCDYVVVRRTMQLLALVQVAILCSDTGRWPHRATRCLKISLETRPDCHPFLIYPPSASSPFMPGLMLQVSGGKKKVVEYDAEDAGTTALPTDEGKHQTHGDRPMMTTCSMVCTLDVGGSPLPLRSLPSSKPAFRTWCAVHL